MKTFIIAIIFSTLATAADGTGTTPMGPATMGQPSYPNSGLEGARSDNMTGNGMSNSTLMGSDVDPTVPTRTPTVEKQKQEETQTGPYKDGVYQYFDKNNRDDKDPND